MHTSIRIDNFRSISSASFSINPGLNVLVGSNGSGKTNLLTSLKFLSYVVKHGAALAMGKIGGPSRNFRRGTNKISFVVISDYGRGRYKGKDTKFFTKWTISVSLVPSEQIIHISQEMVEIFAYVQDGSFAPVLRVSVERSDGTPQRPKVWIEDENLLTRAFVAGASWVSSVGQKSEAFKEAKDGLSKSFGDYKNTPPDASIINQVAFFSSSIRRMLREISSLDEYNIQPDVARQATDPLPITRMGNDGSAVSEVINALETHKFRRISNRYGSYLDGYYNADVFDYDFFRSMEKTNPLAEIVENVTAGINQIDRIGTEIDPSTGRRYVVFYAAGERFRPEEVSDGTIKWLCLLVALYVPRSQIIVLEEPENFMHPWMQQRFVKLARDQSKKSGSSVVLSTHSVTILNSINIDELSIVYTEDGSTRIKKVADRDAIDKILQESSFGLGDIWVSGGIGGVAGD